MSRRRVLEGAVGLVDREGLEALSMRRLGADLSVEAMSLYNHVPSKAALLDGMVEVLLGGLRLPAPEEGWEERIREGYRRFRRLAHEHPNVFPLLLSRPPHSPDGVWLVEEFLATLDEAGFDAETSLRAFRAFSDYTFGYAMAEIRGFALEPDEYRVGGPGLPADEFPHISGLESYLENVDRDAEFEFGLDLIISGLKARR